MKHLERWSVLVMAVSVLASGGLAKEHQGHPKVVDPGSNGEAPSDAVVLFDGKDLSQWESAGGGPAKWEVGSGAMTVKPGTGSIVSKKEFGAMQLHIEWATPSKVSGSGQGRGNSGVYLQRRYEVQVLDSYQNETYPDGQAGALYGKFPPLVNASRKPGKWQTYDMIFHPPKKGDDGEMVPGSLTVLHNGVLIQDHVPIEPGDSVVKKGPILLQDHSNRVRYRNIWVRPLK